MNEELERLRHENARLRATLVLLADPQNWLGDPLSHDALLFGHFTPYEAARDALAEASERKS